MLSNFQFSKFFRNASDYNFGEKTVGGRRSWSQYLQNVSVWLNTQTVCVTNLNQVCWKAKQCKWQNIEKSYLRSIVQMMWNIKHHSNQFIWMHYALHSTLRHFALHQCTNTDWFGDSGECRIDLCEMDERSGHKKWKMSKRKWKRRWWKR